MINLIHLIFKTELSQTSFDFITAHTSDMTGVSTVHHFHLVLFVVIMLNLDLLSPEKADAASALREEGRKTTNPRKVTLFF